MASPLLLVTIGVFGLFHPKELSVAPLFDRPQRLELTPCGVRTPDSECTRTVAFRKGEFVLSVPGKIERRFNGRLEVTASGGELVATVTMDLETAVASVVAAESVPGATLEALKAQAVAARSFFVAARGRHSGFGFCDTTHCQFLREPPAENHPASQAARETRGLLIHYRGATVAALYSANCGGRTKALEQPGYPYYSVECPVRGNVSGHGLGLCQEGAAAMSAAGANFREILSRYFPNTTLGLN